LNRTKGVPGETILLLGFQAIWNQGEIC